ncbi:MAG: 1-acyl-sn-glycerol-3-phosphate acyltransferase [Oligoflexia bacterium]|nr:1-acyl-sn-glycerol-3-phosphate acyltransferase [Oligoflexia bacterium]
MTVILLAHVRAVLLTIIIPIVTFFYSLATVLYFIPFSDRNTMDKVVKSWANVICLLSGLRIHVSGVENLEGVRSALFLSNHQSYYDIPVLFVALTHSFRIAAKKELFKIPFFGQAISKCGFLPVDRSNAEASQKLLSIMQERFKSGENFLMFPEGTRYAGEGVGDFKSGAFHLAIKTEEPIVPISIYGTHKALPKYGYLVNRKQWWLDVYVQVLPVINVSGVSMLQRFELKNQVRTLIASSYAQSQRVANNVVVGLTIQN